MKYSLAFSGLALVAQVSAFPHLAMDALTEPLHDAALSEALSKRQTTAPQGAGALPLAPPPWSPSQKIDVTGQYKWVAPGPTDQRGECPGLNALANHGYLPHNGVATIQQFIDATTKVYGMGVDLATFLAVYGAGVDGTITSWSIGGLPHTGIGGSHGNYETDSSPLKSDLYQYGSLGKLVISQYKTLRDMQPATGANYNLDVLRQFRSKRFQESIDKNPKFVYGPFTGMLVSQAAFTFIYRFMANHTAEAPEGILNRATLNSFMSITNGDSANPTWTFGHERIPDNWYRRNAADAYTIPYFNTDALYVGEADPRILGLGCNQGKVKTYNTIDASTISKGSYTAQQAAANPVCFATAFTAAELPGLTGLSATGAVLKPVLNSLNSVTNQLGCSAITSVNTSALTVCPGFTLYGGPTAPVAAGAIQS